MLRPAGPWYARAAVLAAATLVLISPRALKSPAVWGTIAAGIAVRIASDWPLADNHIYLLAYWSLAIALSLASADLARNVAFNSRMLLGLAFAFAVLWKAFLSPDFLDGRFFRVTLLTDPRFGDIAMLVGGLSAEELDRNRAALQPLPHGAQLLDTPVIVEPRRLRILGLVSTWGILVLESIVALAMLAPAGRVPAAVRHGALLTFCAITYAVAPVAGFGWLLLVMGAAQTRDGQVWLRRGYVASFLLVLFYSEVPWAGLLLDLVR